MIRFLIPQSFWLGLAGNVVNRETAGKLWITKSPKRLHTFSDTPDGNNVATKRIQEIADATLLLQSNCQRSNTHHLDGASELEETWKVNCQVCSRPLHFVFEFCGGREILGSEV